MCTICCYVFVDRWNGAEVISPQKFEELVTERVKDYLVSPEDMNDRFDDFLQTNAEFTAYDLLTMPEDERKTAQDAFSDYLHDYTKELLTDEGWEYTEIEFEEGELISALKGISAETLAKLIQKAE